MHATVTPPPTDLASCCEQAYFCPASNEVECGVHGGFDTCCARPDLHHPVVEGSGWCPTCRAHFAVIWPAPPYALLHVGGDVPRHGNPVTGTAVAGPALPRTGGQQPQCGSPDPAG